MSDPATAEIGHISFTVDTRQLLDLDAVLAGLAKRAESTEAALNRMAATTKNAYAGTIFAGGGASTSSNAAPAAIKATTEAIEQQTSAVERATTAHKSHGAAANAARIQMLELGHVSRALFDEVAAGGSLFRGLLMESGRLQIAWSQGGLFETIGSAATRALSFVNPFTLAGTALVGFGGAAALATMHTRELREEMERSVSGAGRASGLSGEGLAALAARSTDLPFGISASVAGRLAGTGRLDAGSIESVLGLTKGYAGAFDVDYGKAGTALADIFTDPARGAEKLNDRLGFLDDRTRAYIRTLQQQGDQQAAVKALIDASSTSMLEQAQPADPLDRLGQWWSGRNAAVEAVFASPNSIPLERYRDSSGFFDPEAENYNAAEEVRRAGQRREMERRDVLSSRESLAAGDIIRSVMPELGERMKLVDQQSALSKALADPTVVTKLGPTADEAHQALDRLTTGLATFKTGLQRLAEEGDLAVRQALARTASERTAVESQRTYLTTLERTHDVLQASQAAENQRAEAIANSTRTALDALRATTDRAALVGLSPYDRIMRQSEQHFRDLQEQVVTGPVATGSAISLPASGSGFESALARTLGFEGGLNPRDTNGTPSNMGINGAAYPGLDITRLSQSQAAGIYQRDYWIKIGADSMSPQMARVAFDTAVMEGVGQAMKLIDRSGGDAGKLLDLRQEFEGSLLARNPGKYGPYAKAWADRDAGLRADIGGSAFTPPDSGSAVLANRLNYTVGRQADVQALLMGGPQQSGIHLEAQLASLKAQESALGGTPSTLAAAVEKQREWNEVAAAGVTQQKLLTSFGEAGSRMWTDLTSKIDLNAAAAARLAGEQDRLRKLTDGMDTLRGDTSDLFGGMLKAGAHGTSFGAALSGSLSRIEDQLLDKASSALTSGLFGQGGSGGGGIFGSLLGGLMGGGGFQGWMPAFAGGTDDAPGGVSLVGEKGPELVNLPAHAQVIPAGPTAKILGGGGGRGDDAPIHVTINNHHTSAAVTAQHGPMIDGRRSLQLEIVNTMVNDLHTNGKFMQTLTKRSGVSRTGG